MDRCGVDRSRFGLLEDPEQQNERDDDMPRKRQSVGHAAVVGFPQKEMQQPFSTTATGSSGIDSTWRYFTLGMPLASTGG
jgi:hypothetical protein